MLVTIRKPRPFETMTVHPIKVLIVEGMPEHANLLLHILNESAYPEYQAVAVPTLADCLTRLSAGGINVVLLDLTLPDSGPEKTFHAVNKAAPDIAVVVISGVADVSTALEIVQAGAQDYLIKGEVDHKVVIRSLQYAFERKRAQVALRHAHDQLEQRVQERTSALVASNQQLQTEIAERKKAEEAAVLSNGKLKQALADLHAAQQELVVRERRAAFGEMAHGIAHELNNVLTPILAWTEHLLQKPEELGDSEQVRETIQKINSAASVGAAAVGRVMNFAVDGEPAYTRINLAEIAEEASAAAEHAWRTEAGGSGAYIEIRRLLSPVPEVVGERAELSQLVSHLISNAAHAISGRGTITITTSINGESVVIAVRDDGSGMDASTRERCLDRDLGSRHPDGRSSGHGTIHGILQRHNGRLSIESVVGRGTKVSIFLPFVATDAPETTGPGSETIANQTAETTQTSVNAGKQRRILLAEDDMMVSEVMVVYLSEDGFDITVTSNGRECVEAFTRANGAFDLVITDRAMPEMGGDEVALAVKRINPKVPVLLLTGFGELMNSEGEKPEGVDLVVGKPFTMTSLRAALETVGF